LLQQHHAFSDYRQQEWFIKILKSKMH